MKYRRKRPRPGRHLPAHNSLSLLAASQTAITMHWSLLAQGYRLMPKLRPYLRHDGQVSLRFVWRRRSARGDCVTIDYTGRFRLEA